MVEVRDVVVVGAGPTGLALAIALRRYGLDVLVVEKEPGTKKEPRASIIWQRALEAMRDLGCADDLAGAGLVVRRGAFRVRGRLCGEYDMAMPGTAFPCPLSIEQDATERLLRRRLRALGDDVGWATEAVAVRVGADGAEVDLRGPDGRGRTVACRWLVGCEGAHSIVRKTLGIPFDGERRADLQAVQMNAKPDWRFPQDPHLTQIFLHRGVSLIVSPLPGGGHRFFAFRDDPEPRLEEPPSTDEMRELVVRATGDPDVRLVPTTPPWTNRARFHDRLAASLRHGAALLAGDSAHLWAPVGGHGLNAGLCAAHNLGWKLAAVHQGRCRETLLDTYSAEQRRTAAGVMRDMRHNLTELPPGPLTLAALSLAAPVVIGSRRAERRTRLMMSDFARHHRPSALTTDTGRRGPLRAGDRLPDLPVRERDGTRRRLHDLLSYRRWTLLVFEGRGGGAEFRGLVERYGAGLRTFRVRAEGDAAGAALAGTLLLVRPDGYVGLRAPSGDRDALAGYLERWFAPRRDLPG
ncbi:FAD-dependent oxidoreductase [Streptomyces huiliensis]|uniref:FAD-dependent oxidoreductase n=1 Tax=Streptomyces huiliensis TaxID=2876027 RepID=UPI001CBF8EF7|nr:FAD-dependent oxidoreductase [Streptomyces huiliensis]MBZ4320008.1 FAD-dependent oxidoreductase [Streptomyces huiliensis]